VAGASAIKGHLLSAFATNLFGHTRRSAPPPHAIFLIADIRSAIQRGRGETLTTRLFGGTAHVVLGSGLTIAVRRSAALHHLPYFQTLGIPLAIGMVVVVPAASPLAPR